MTHTEGIIRLREIRQQIKSLRNQRRLLAQQLRSLVSEEKALRAQGIRLRRYSARAPEDVEREKKLRMLRKMLKTAPGEVINRLLETVKTE